MIAEICERARQWAVRRKLLYFKDVDKEMCSPFEYSLRKKRDEIR